MTALPRLQILPLQPSRMFQGEIEEEEAAEEEEEEEEEEKRKATLWSLKVIFRISRLVHYPPIKI